jgi:hypothetical protein
MGVKGSHAHLAELGELLAYDCSLALAIRWRRKRASPVARKPTANPADDSR